VASEPQPKRLRAASPASIEAVAARLLATVETVTDLVTLHDLDGRVFWLNRAAREFFELGPDDPLPPLLPTDFLTLSEAEIDEMGEVLEREDTWDGELDIVGPDGKTMPGSIVVVAQRDESGEVAYFSAVTRDISDRRAVQEKLLESEVWFRSLVQNSSDLLVVIDDEWRVVFASPSACQFLEHSLEHLVGQRLEIAIHPADSERIRHFFFELRKRPGETDAVEYRVIRPDGSVWWLEMIATNLLENPAVQGIVTNSRDVTERKIAEFALLENEARMRHNEARYRGVVEDQTELVCRYLPDTTLTFVNRAFADFYGRAPEEMIGLKLLETTFPQNERAAELERLSTFGRGNEVQTQDDWELRSDGAVRWYRWTDRAFLDAAGNVVEFQSVGHDITGERRVAQLTKRQAELLEQIARGLPLHDTLVAVTRTIEEQHPALRASILLYDADAQVLRHGAAPSLPPAYVAAIDGIAIGPSVGSCGTAVFRRRPVHVRDIGEDPLWADFRDLALTHDLRACWSTPIFASDGERVLGAFAVYARQADDPSGELLELVGLLTHVAAIAIERKESEDRLAHQSFHDPLTDLPNRTLFLDRLGQALARSRRTGHGAAVLFLDLDRFKTINDSLGHELGDELLVAIARRLESVIRPGDTIARFGGDEFTVVCEELPPGRARERAGEIAARLSTELADPFVLQGGEIYLGASIGIAVAVTGEERPEELLRDADAAMYHAKEQGRGRFVVFDDAMRARALARHAIETALHRAVERGEFRVFYQPIVSLTHERCVGAEALVRWQHPERGLVTPGEFVPLAEETGLIIGLGSWVLEEAARQAARWQEETSEPFFVSVNLSARQLAQPDLAEAIASALDAANLEPDRLCLEITESVLMDDADVTLAALERVRALGVRFSIDDFGTGYSSLAYLKRFPVDAVKIDRSFTDGLGIDAGDTAIVSAVIGLSHALGLDVVAEGVETEAQLAELSLLGCDQAQGYLFATPRPPSDLRGVIGRTTAIPGRAARGRATSARRLGFGLRRRHSLPA
jgi:diguanylate cyclase (GGDEF)-like protein/PAS domain S-box-containing protein